MSTEHFAPASFLTDEVGETAWELGILVCTTIIIIVMIDFYSDLEDILQRD